MILLTEYLNEHIQQINELSDETLKSAIKKSYERGTTLDRRRAKEFEKYLKDPERIEREKLLKGSKIQKDVAALIDKYLIPAYETYDNSKTRKQSLRSFEIFVWYYVKLITDNCKEDSIEVDAGDVHFSGGRDFTRKRHGALFGNDEDRGLYVNLGFNLIGDNRKFHANDFSTYFQGTLYFNFYKIDLRNYENKHKNKGLFSVYFSCPDGVVPVEYHKAWENISKVIGEAMCYTNNYDRYYTYALSDKSINTKLSTVELLVNSFGPGCNASFDKIFDELKNTLKINDENCNIENIGNRNEEKTGNNLVNAPQFPSNVKSISATLIYKDKTYDISCQTSRSYLSDQGRIFINNELVFYANDSYYKPDRSNLRKVFGND